MRDGPVFFLLDGALVATRTWDELPVAGGGLVSAGTAIAAFSSTGSLSEWDSVSYDICPPLALPPPGTPIEIAKLSVLDAAQVITAVLPSRRADQVTHQLVGSGGALSKLERAELFLGAGRSCAAVGSISAAAGKVDAATSQVQGFQLCPGGASCITVEGRTASLVSLASARVHVDGARTATCRLDPTCGGCPGEPVLSFVDRLDLDYGDGILDELCVEADQAVVAATISCGGEERRVEGLAAGPVPGERVIRSCRRELLLPGGCGSSGPYPLEVTAWSATGLPSAPVLLPPQEPIVDEPPSREAPSPSMAQLVAAEVAADPSFNVRWHAERLTLLLRAASSFVPSPPPDLQPSQLDAIARAFLVEKRDLYELPEELVLLGLPELLLDRTRSYRAYHLVWLAQEVSGVPVDDPPLVVTIDLAGRVSAVSGSVYTPGNLDADVSQAISRQAATAAALALGTAETGLPEAAFHLEAALVVSPSFGRPVWRVHVLTPADPVGFNVLYRFDARTGELLDAVSQALEYRATVKRYRFSNGDSMAPSVTTSTVASSGSSSFLRWLESEHFYLFNERNCVGEPLGACPGGVVSECTSAWARADTGVFVQPTTRLSSRFVADPGQTANEQFSEQNTFWWLKALDSEYLSFYEPYTEQAVVVTNGCRPVFRPGETVQAWFDRGETVGSVVHLPTGAQYVPFGTDNLAATCSGAECSVHPGLIMHEFQHWFLHDVIGLPSGAIACDDLSRSIHEGTTGSRFAQLFWLIHHGAERFVYDDTADKFWNYDSARGVPHLPGGVRNDCLDDSERPSVRTKACYSRFPCDDATASEYSRGNVLGQPLWELFWGHDCDNSLFNPLTMRSTCSSLDASLRPSNPVWAEDFNEALMYALKGVTTHPRTFAKAADLFFYYLRNYARAPIGLGTWARGCGIVRHHGIDCWFPRLVVTP